MARARAKRNRQIREIAEIIAAEWYRMLPETSSGTKLPMDANALTLAFNEILDQQVVALPDTVPLTIVVPQPPKNTKAELRQYFANNPDFFDGMGAAALFGCGR